MASIAIPMYEKGRSFVLAAGLVKANYGHRFVYLHLLCQGLENIAKAILLRVDEPHYGPRLREQFGHDLEKLVVELTKKNRAGFLSPRALNELSRVNDFYKRHRFRYGDAIDSLPKAREIAADALHYELVQALGPLNEEFESEGAN